MTRQYIIFIFYFFIHCAVSCRVVIGVKADWI